MEDLSVIILAGGKSSRMGEDKGLMSLFGRPMIGYILDRAKELSNNIIIVAENSNYKQFEGVRLVKDIYKDHGPLGGIYTGLTKSETKKNLVLSCDVPYVRAGLLKFMLYQQEGFDATIPSHDGRIHPLIGVYNQSCLEILEKRLRSGQLKITDAFTELNVNIVDANEFDAVEFKNLNSKRDIISF